MELLSLRLTPSPSSSTSSLPAALAHCSKLCEFQPRKKKKACFDAPRLAVRCVKASAERTGDTIDDGEARSGFTTPAMEVTTFNRSTFSDAADFPVWEKIGAVVRLSYGIGIYGAMAVAGSFICSITGIDSLGGFHLSLDAILEGLGYAAPPIMALLFILDDEVVKLSPHARAIRDVEDEELWSFFYGMSPWQGALADIFLRGSNLITDVQGMASLTGVLPPFVPFAQAFAAVLTAVLTGSLYYMAASPKDPTYVVAPVLQSRSGRQDLKKLFEAWYEKRQMKKIYSPLLEGLLALYLGFEWIQNGYVTD
uniref:Protein STAY-GREEN n=1 Tax=Glycine max TaxID=3847 RepID=I1J9J1_SOYBN